MWPGQLRVVAERELLPDLTTTIVEDRRGIESGELLLGRPRPALEVTRAPIGLREAAQDLDAFAALPRRRRIRCAPVCDGAGGIRERARPEARQLAVQLEGVLGRHHEQSLEGLRSICVTRERALQPLEPPAESRSSQGSAASGDS